MKKGIFSGILLLTVLSGGCFFPDSTYEKTNYYALGIPQTVKINSAGLNIGLFNNVACSTQRMVYRKNYTILMDNYNKWAKSPEFMVKAYLDAALASKNPQKSYDLNGSIFLFEIDLIKKQAILGVHYTVSDKDSEKLLVERNSVFKNSYKTADGTEFARAMTGNLNLLAQEIADVLKSIPFKKKLDK